MPPFRRLPSLSLLSTTTRTLAQTPTTKLLPRTATLITQTFNAPSRKTYASSTKPLNMSASTAMAAKTPEGEIISQVAKEEGGPSKGSLAAQMQSEADRAENAAQVDAELKAKMERGEMVGQDEAALAQSREARAPVNAPAAGTVASEAKSQADKEANAMEAARHMAEKMATDPSSITSEDAQHLESRLHRATGERPGPDSLAAKAKSIASANEKGEPVAIVADAATQTGPVETPGEALAGADKSNLTREGQAQVDREANFQKVAEGVAEKMVVEPENVTKEEAALLHSREERAHGKAAKGGIAAEAQKTAAENEKAGLT